MKILIVDDNLSMRKVLSALFESQGHQVVAALEDGCRLADCIKDHSPDLVCLDYNLPGQNGLELLKAVHASTPDVSVVVMTGSDDQSLVGQAADAGASGFLHKPFSPPQILGELKHIEEIRGITDRMGDEKQSSTSPDSERSKRTAVIADDSGSIRMLLKGLLLDAGLQVLQMVGNGQDGIDAAKKHRPALMFLDVEMPGMSGLEALPLILVASPKTKVVMVTGNASRTVLDASVAGGATGYILKPVRPAYVESMVMKMLAS